jgi:hypothetical protein
MCLLMLSSDQSQGSAFFSQGSGLFSQGRALLDRALLLIASRFRSAGHLQSRLASDAHSTTGEKPISFFE